MRSIMGVYGNWIIIYGRQLDQRDILVQDIMAAYKSYQQASRNCDSIIVDEAIQRLFLTIDEFCRTRKFETPQQVGFPNAEVLHEVYRKIEYYEET